MDDPLPFTTEAANVLVIRGRSPALPSLASHGRTTGSRLECSHVTGRGQRLRLRPLFNREQHGEADESDACKLLRALSQRLVQACPESQAHLGE